MFLVTSWDVLWHNMTTQLSLGRQLFEFEKTTCGGFTELTTNSRLGNQANNRTNIFKRLQISVVSACDKQIGGTIICSFIGLYYLKRLTTHIAGTSLVLLTKVYNEKIGSVSASYAAGSRLLLLNHL